MKEPRRPLAARADACRLAIKVLTKAIALKSVRPTELAETIERLCQASEFLDECVGKERSIAIIVGRKPE